MESRVNISLVTVYLLLGMYPALAQIVPYEEANSHVGQTVTIEGQITQIFTSHEGDTFIDMGGRYPNQIFSGVIFADSATAVGTLDNLIGKTIDLTWNIVIYRSKPEIIIASRSQFKVK